MNECMIIENKINKAFWPQLKIPLVAVGVFIFLVAQTIFNPNALGFKSFKTYKFNSQAIGFYASDLTFFRYTAREEAEAKLVSSFPPELQSKVKKVIRPVLVLCEKYQVDPFWVLAVMWTESHFKIHVTSKKGASGLMQIMPQTYDAILEVMKSKDIKFESQMEKDYLAETYTDSYAGLTPQKFTQKLNNLEVGIYYLKMLLDNFNSNHTYATVAYNMGPSWTRVRIRNNVAVGLKNLYLNKVMKAYFYLAQNLSEREDIRIVQVQRDL
jgi:soluble lytic murein transglycosylase-like protein